MEEESESTTPTMEEEIESTTGPNWLDLPIDLTENILQRLGTVEILTSACRVCAQWWNICKDPLMWRTIRIRYVYKLHYYLRKICCNAVKRSCGLLEDIDIEYSCTDDILKCIADNGSHLRCMRLVDCWNITEEGFSEAMRKLPQLEKVDISNCNHLTDVYLEALGRSCPLLKSLKFEKSRFAYFDSDEMAFAIAETMPGLRYLDMKGHDLTKLGVLTIIVNCPLLESLDIRDCHYLNKDLEKRCIDQINDLLMPVRYNDDIYYDLILLFGAI